MKFSLVGSGALLVENGGTGPWLFGAPFDIANTLDSNGLEVPNILFTTGYQSPGLGRLGKPVIRYKQEPLNLEAMKATPINTPGGVDYKIESADGTILFTQRPNLTQQETQGYDLVVSCKEVGESCGDNVVILNSLEETTVLDGTLVDGKLTIEYKESTDPTESSEDKKKKDPILDTEDDIVDLAEKEEKKKEGYPASDFLVVGDKQKTDTWHLQVSRNGKYDMDLIGGAAAALGPKGYRGNRYEGPDKDKAKAKLRAIYGKLDKPVPEGLKTAMKELSVQRIGDMLAADLHKAYGQTLYRLKEEGYVQNEELESMAGALNIALKELQKSLPDDIDMRIYTDPATTMTIQTALKEHGYEFDMPEDIGEQWCGVYKDVDGNDRWVSISSVASWDKHNELFTTEAMDWALKFNQLIGKEIHGGNFGPLRYRHIPGVDGGYCDNQLRCGDYFFETGGFYDNPVGDSMKRKLKEESGDWGISLGLLYRPTDIINGKYQRAIPFERSMTPKPANVMAVMSIAQKEDDQNE